jgi:hypothetical protein
VTAAVSSERFASICQACRNSAAFFGTLLKVTWHPSVLKELDDAWTQRSQNTLRGQAFRWLRYPVAFALDNHTHYCILLRNVSDRFEPVIKYMRGIF